MVTLTTISSGIALLALTASWWGLRKKNDLTPECYCAKALGVPVCSDRPNLDGKPLWTVIHDQFLNLELELAQAYADNKGLRRDLSVTKDRVDDMWDTIGEYQRELDACQWGRSYREKGMA